MNDAKKCYECKILEHIPDHFPFCSELCHKMWVDKNYPDKNKQTLEEKLKKWRNI